MLSKESFTDVKEKKQKKENITLIAEEDFNAAEDGITVVHHTKGEKFIAHSKEFADLLTSNGHARLDKDLETKVVKPEETKDKRKSTKEVK